MNLYCKDQKTISKSGKKNWDSIFNNRYLVVCEIPGIFKIYKCKKVKDKYITGCDKKVINPEHIKGIFDSDEDAEKFLKRIK